MTKNKQFWLALAVAWSTASSLLAQPTAPAGDDFMASTGKIYVVVAVLGIILIGIFLFLIRMDRKLSRLEKNTKD